MQSKLKQKDGLPDNELYVAIAWSAKEDKIKIEYDKNEDSFYLRFNRYF